MIPDVHQDIAWVQRVLAREAMQAWDLLVFLGDYFDTRTPRTMRTGVRATCEYLEKLRADYAGRVVFLLGNHDIQYLEAKPACDLHRKPRQQFYDCGPSYSQAAAEKVAKGLSDEFWADTRLFVAVNGWLLSHAGVAPVHWPHAETVEASLASLDAECRIALTTMRRGPHPLLEAGVVRGGDARIGGITWQDWEDEFEDALPLPQIVGHTRSDRARQQGRSWCLDGAQSCYGVLTRDGLQVKPAPEDFGLTSSGADDEES